MTKDNKELTTTELIEKIDLFQEDADQHLRELEGFETRLNHFNKLREDNLNEAEKENLKKTAGEFQEDFKKLISPINEFSARYRRLNTLLRRNMEERLNKIISIGKRKEVSFIKKNRTMNNAITVSFGGLILANTIFPNLDVSHLSSVGIISTTIISLLYYKHRVSLKNKAITADIDNTTKDIEEYLELIAKFENTNTKLEKILSRAAKREVE